MRLTRLIGCLLLSLISLGPVTGSEFAAQEVWRIRIVNKPKGLVQVSTNHGRTYATVGRVKVIANARISGFAAASYTPRATVAAVSVHGIRIKTGQGAQGLGKAQQPLMFSVTPCEFAVIPHFFGGHQARSAQIITDIHSGRSIFRNLAPYVGNPVFLEQGSSLTDLPEDYAPTGGETFVIVVNKPEVTPKQIVFDNRAGGAVTVDWHDGRSEKLTEVVRPVTGVGRYDGTTFTGTGSINTNHGGVITIGTAPLSPLGAKEGGPVETRGGFMIQPSYHVREQRETSPQVMVVGPTNPGKPVLEGTPPLFQSYIGLARYPSAPSASYRVDVRIDNGDWELPPAIVGRVDNAFSAEYLGDYFAKLGKPRTVTEGVTALRIFFPDYDPKVVADGLAKEATDYARSVSGAPCLSDATVLKSSRRLPAGSAVYFYVDGVMVNISNRPPHTYTWDTTKVPNGLHEVVVKTVLPSGECTAEPRQVLVSN